MVYENIANGIKTPIKKIYEYIDGRKQEIQERYEYVNGRKELVFQNIKTDTNVIDSQGNIKSGTNISGGGRSYAPDAERSIIYYYVIGTPLWSSRVITVNDGTTNINCGTMNLGIYAGKNIKTITANICGCAVCSRLNDQANGRTIYRIKDNLGNVLWSRNLRIGDFNNNPKNTNFANIGITLNINRVITSLNCEISYTNISLEDSREMTGPVNISFRSMNITYQ